MLFPSEQVSECDLMQFCIGFLMSVHVSLKVDLQL